MRKTSRPNTAEVVGSISKCIFFLKFCQDFYLIFALEFFLRIFFILGRRDVAYKQLLKKFTCYDLMPSQGALVAIDSQLSVSQLFIQPKGVIFRGFLCRHGKH